MTTLTAVIGLFQDAVAGITGIKYAPEMPPENPSDFPFVTVYPWDFRSEMNTPQDYKTMYGIRVELHVARKDLPSDVSTAIGFAELVPKALFTVCITNSIACEGITGQFGELGWSEVKTIGFSWLIRDVKILTTL